MATYKVIQDIEAEDKILGPLTLKQFILVILDMVLIFIGFRLAVLHWFLAIPFIPPVAFLSILAAPIKRDQPTDIWLAAKLRFILIPRKRLWDQSGVINYVTVTAPKKIERIYTDGLNQMQVRSRLTALANTLDSRGWAVKNISVNTYGQVAYASDFDDSDRLVPASSLPQDVPTIQVMAEDDIMDEVNNPLARQMDELIKQQTEAYRQRLIDQVRKASPSMPITSPATSADSTFTEPAPVPDYSFLEPPATQTSVTQPTPLVPVSPPQPATAQSQITITTDDKPVEQAQTQQQTPSPITANPDEQALLEQIHKDQKKEHDQEQHSHLKRLKTREEIEQDQARIAKQQADELAAKELADQELAKMTKHPSADTIELAKSNDLKVGTLQKLANRPSLSEEVVISLHNT